MVCFDWNRNVRRGRDNLYLRFLAAASGTEISRRVPRFSSHHREYRRFQASARELIDDIALSTPVSGRIVAGKAEMDIVDCQHCGTRVAPMTDWTCPSCRRSTLEPANPEKPRTERRPFVFHRIVCVHVTGIALQSVVLWQPTRVQKYFDEPAILIFLPPCLLLFIACPIAALIELLRAKHGMTWRQVTAFLLLEALLTFTQWTFLIDPYVQRIPKDFKSRQVPSSVKSADQFSS